MNGMKRTVRRFTNLEREEITARMREIMRETQSPKIIAKRLGQLGHKMSDGSAMDEGWIKLTIGKIKSTTATSQPVGVRPGILPESVIGILTDPTLLDAQKVKMIMAYATVLS